MNIRSDFLYQNICNTTSVEVNVSRCTQNKELNNIAHNRTMIPTTNILSSELYQSSNFVITCYYKFEQQAQVFNFVIQ